MTAAQQAELPQRQQGDDRLVAIDHFVKGKVVRGGGTVHRAGGGVSFEVPALDLDALVWPRTSPGPAFDVPLDEVIDVLVATGDRLRTDPGGHVAEALALIQQINPLAPAVLERCYGDLPAQFARNRILDMIDGEIGGPTVLDGWADHVSRDGRKGRYRAFPPRLVHVLAGNGPSVAAFSIVRGALSKGVHLMKLPSNDPITATAILKTMAEAALDHPVTRSFSTVYWRGGDSRVEQILYQPTYFDKLVAWGGEAALRSAKDYIGPGFELVAYDPKSSISFIGREAFASEETLAEVADAAAADATVYNQLACVAARFQFVEGTEDEVDRYCEALQRALGLDRHLASAVGPKLAPDLREEIDALRDLDPMYGVWGRDDGRGIVVRSDEPVDFHPDGKVVNVVPVRDLADAVRFANVATQTVGVYPPERKVALRDALANCGVQRIVRLGKAIGGPAGMSHDGFFPLHRMVRWVNEED